MKNSNGLEMNLTKQQAAGLEKLEAALKNPTFQYGNIQTGVNSQTLFGLIEKGILKCSHLYLRGVVSADATIEKEAK